MTAGSDPTTAEEIISVRVHRTGRLLAAAARKAVSLRQRTVGLLDRDALLPGEGLVIFSLAPSIHTFGMRFAIDLVFFDRLWKVVALRQDVKPGRLLLPVWAAWGVLEVAAGTVSQAGVQDGDLLEALSAADLDTV